MKMGKKGNWFSAVKKALSPQSKGTKVEKSDNKPKKKWFGKPKNQKHVSLSEETVISNPVEDAKLTDPENKQSKHVYSIDFPTTVAAEAAEVVRLTSVAHLTGKSKDEIAAIRIQTAFRGYLARRALRALRGLVRLKLLIQGESVKRQTSTTLQCMQTLARVQSQIRARRIRMSEENQALQRQIQKKHEKELEKLRASTGEEWDDTIHSKERIEANLLSKHEAAIRRERALAYGYSHQQTLKNSRSANPTFMDSNNPHWGWSWLERWMAARPWESQSTTEFRDNASTTKLPMSIRKIIKSNYCTSLIYDNKHSPTGQKSKPASSQGSGWGGDNDSRSILSFQSERYRRHSIAGSSVRDDESLSSSPSVPSYMALTKSAKAKCRLPSPLGTNNNATAEKGHTGSAKKRLSFSASPTGQRRHSDPPKVSISSIKEPEVRTGEN